MHVKSFVSFFNTWRFVNDKTLLISVYYLSARLCVTRTLLRNGYIYELLGLHWRLPSPNVLADLVSHSDSFFYDVMFQCFWIAFNFVVNDKMRPLLIRSSLVSSYRNLRIFSIVHAMKIFERASRWGQVKISSDPFFYVGDEFCWLSACRCLPERCSFIPPWPKLLGINFVFGNNMISRDPEPATMIEFLISPDLAFA